MAVYYIRNETSGLIKIGTAVDLKRRIRYLQTATPDMLVFVRVLEGGEAEEDFLHAKYAKYHVAGEWFALPKKLIFQRVGLMDLSVPAKSRRSLVRFMNGSRNLRRERMARGRPMIGDAPMTSAEKQAKRRSLYKTYKEALQRITECSSLKDAISIAQRAREKEGSNVK